MASSLSEPAKKRRAGSCTEDGIETHTCYRSNRLIPLLLVNHADQRLSGEIAAEVLAEEIDAAADAKGGAAGTVRRDDHVLHAPERMIVGQGLPGKNVQAGAADLSRGQRLHERIS